jgi:hypothetical protein
VCLDSSPHSYVRNNYYKSSWKAHSRLSCIVDAVVGLPSSLLFFQLVDLNDLFLGSVYTI